MFACTLVDEDFKLFIPDVDLTDDSLLHNTARPVLQSMLACFKTAATSTTKEQKEKLTFIPSYYPPNVVQNEFSFCSSWNFSNDDANKKIATQSEEGDKNEHLKTLIFKTETCGSQGFTITTTNDVEFLISRATIWAEVETKNNNKKSKHQKVSASSISNPTATAAALPPFPILLSATISSRHLNSTSVFKSSKKNPEVERQNKVEEYKVTLGIFNFHLQQQQEQQQNINLPACTSQLLNLSLPIDRDSTVRFELIPLIPKNSSKVVTTTNNTKDKNNITVIKLRLWGKYQTRLDWIKRARMLYAAPSLMPIHFKKRKNFEDGLFPPHRIYGVKTTSNNNNLVALTRQPQLEVLPPGLDSNLGVLSTHQLRCLPASVIHTGDSGDKEALVIQEQFIAKTERNLVKLFNDFMNGEKDGDFKYAFIGLDDKAENKPFIKGHQIQEDLDYFLNHQSMEKKNPKSKNKNKNGQVTHSSFFVQPSEWSPLLVHHHPKFKQFLVRYTPAARSRPVNIRRFPHRNSDVVGELKFGHVCEATGVIFDEIDKDWYVEWRYIGGYSRLRGTFGPFLVALWNPEKRMETTIFDPPRFFAPAAAEDKVSVRVRSAPDIHKGKRTQVHLQHNEIRAAVAMHRDLKNGSVFVEWADGSGFSRKSGRVLKLMIENDGDDDENEGDDGNDDNDDNNDDDDDEEDEEENNADAERIMNRIARNLRRQRRVGLARSTNNNNYRRRNGIIDPDFTPFGGARKNKNDSSRRRQREEDDDDDEFNNDDENDNDDEDDPDETRMLRNNTNNNNNNNNSIGGSTDFFPPPIITPARLRRKHKTRDLVDSSSSSSSSSASENSKNSNKKLFHDEDFGSSSSSSSDEEKTNNNNNDNDADNDALKDEIYEERIFLVELPQIRNMLMRD